MGRTKIAGVCVMLDISSPKRVEVRLDLDPDTRLDTLYVQALSPLGAVGAEPIQGIRLEKVNEYLTVRLQVPPGQPAGTYLARVIDPERAEQRGTLRVIVKD
jgi:hypothetical protein